MSIIKQTLEDARKELNAMADRCRDMAQELEEIADGLPRTVIDGPHIVNMGQGRDFDEAVTKALQNILARKGKENP